MHRGVEGVHDAAFEFRMRGVHAIVYNGDGDAPAAGECPSLLDIHVFVYGFAVDGRWWAAAIEWETLIPDWINWHIEREEAGWVFHDGEKPVGFDLATNFGSIRVSGFVDRLDIHPELGVEVIDYKYSSKNSINKKKSNIEDDPQLVIYAKAVDGDDIVNRQTVSNASWVSIKEANTAIQVEDLSEHVNELPAQMTADIEALWGGSPVIASAPDSICQYCQARGVCRKGMWS